jgi:transposase InsO family protein
MARRYGPLTQARYLSAENPSSFGGRSIVKRYARPIEHASTIEDFLASVNTYTLHRQVKPPKKNPIFVHRLRELIQCDITDRQAEAGENDGYKYWLCVQDTFSRFLWVTLLRTKAGNVVADAFKRILENVNLNGTPERCLSDRGAEFKSRVFRAVLRDNDIEQSFPIYHAPHIERVQQTLQNLVSKYQTEHATGRYVHVLAKLVRLYNSKFHRSIQMTPEQAENGRNHDKVRLALSEFYHKARLSRKKPKYKIGDWVRVVNVRGKFTRGYNQTFGPNMYRIRTILVNLPRPMYTLESSGGEIQLDKYYEEELQLIKGTGPNGTIFKVNKIIGRRRNRTTGVREVLVNWVGFEENTGTWEDASDVIMP